MIIIKVRLIYPSMTPATLGQHLRWPEGGYACRGASELDPDHHKPSSSAGPGILGDDANFPVRYRYATPAGAPKAPDAEEPVWCPAVADEQLCPRRDPLPRHSQPEGTLPPVKREQDVADRFAPVVEPRCHGEDRHRVRHGETAAPVSPDFARGKGRKI